MAWRWMHGGIAACGVLVLVVQIVSGSPSLELVPTLWAVVFFGWLATGRRPPGRLR